MHIDNVRAQRAADEAELDMFKAIAREIDGPPPPGIGALLKRALTDTRPSLSEAVRTVPNLDPWQRPEDGFPSDAYFEAVAADLRAAGVQLNDWHREEAWEVVYELADDVVAASAYAWAEHGLYVSWRVDEQSEPLTEGFTAIGGLDLPGWFWVPYSKPGAGGDFAKNFGIAELAEPEDVAAAVWQLLHPDAARTVPTVTAPYSVGGETQ